jgi:hypothetical protein
VNRFFRRMTQFGKRHQDVLPSIVDAKTPQDVTSVRAKSEGHKKKTADKWNQ